jgi:acetoacetyl-[acyl-carrier protein] synthase
MVKLPIIVGFGGINSAGRSSCHQGYRRLVLDALSLPSQQQTLHSLASLTGKIKKPAGTWVDKDGSDIDLPGFLLSNAAGLRASSLIRGLENNLFDPAHIPHQAKATLRAPGPAGLSFKIKTAQLSQPLPQGWECIEVVGDDSIVRVNDGIDVLLPRTHQSPVSSAGQLPSGFDPGELYASRNHPRGLQMTVFAASDAINSMGIGWDTIRQTVAPDQISVYAGSGLGQLDYNGNGGLLQARLLGKKVSSKQLALGYAEMPADFINAYLLGNLGTTGTSVAACATFLYNLRQGIRDIQSGVSRVVIVGTSEAPLLPEVFDGFNTMGALADDESLRKLDKLPPGKAEDFKQACRPFGNNVGFTLSESAQVVVLFDDALTIELGAQVFAAVNDVFINADGFKKSIASPGVGNYLSMAKAAAATANIIGAEGLKQRSYVHSHGTGTPQNRTTESHILSTTATQFKIDAWPVVAIKSYIGHSLASSAGDQIMASLGFWSEGILPGILTIDELADDVSSAGIDFQLAHKQLSPTSMDATIINSKGFGGNNASASLIAPHIALGMLRQRYGDATMTAYEHRNEKVKAQCAENEARLLAGEHSILYQFDNNVLDASALAYSQTELHIKGVKPSISLNVANHYSDMIKKGA